MITFNILIATFVTLIYYSMTNKRNNTHIEYNRNIVQHNMASVVMRMQYDMPLWLILIFSLDDDAGGGHLPE